MSSIYNGNISISVFGESHGAAIGVVLDGFPAGVEFNQAAVETMLMRRRPKRAAYSTRRAEKDLFRVLSGITNGFTNGSPLCMTIENTDARPSDYDKNQLRPSHADYTAAVRYAGFNAVSGGGHFSGRLTAALVMAGAVCAMYLEQFGISISAHIAQAGGVSDTPFDPVNPTHTSYDEQSGLSVNSKAAGQKMLDAMRAAASAGDSVGGIIECAATGVCAGIGSPNAAGIENRISLLAFCVPAVKGIEFGAGFALAGMKGSQSNDAITQIGAQAAVTATNHSGGINGGISNGMPIIFRTVFRPTPSISLPQQSTGLDGKQAMITIKGRHDPCIVPRAVPVMESVMAIALADLYKGAKGYAHTR